MLIKEICDIVNRDKVACAQSIAFELNKPAEKIKDILIFLDSQGIFTISKGDSRFCDKCTSCHKCITKVDTENLDKSIFIDLISKGN